MNSGFLKLAYQRGYNVAIQEWQTSKTAAMERIFISAAQLAKSKAAREAAKAASKKPGIFSKLRDAFKGGYSSSATDTATYQKYRNAQAAAR